MKVFILFDVVDCSDIYAEANILMVSQDYDKITARMKELWRQCVDDEDPATLDNDETWCGGTEAYVVADQLSYYHHSFWIEQHEVV